MTIQEFERLLQQAESNILDFKRQQYDFSNDNEQKKAADFLKDIISFCNTIRTETAYIIVGVEIQPDGTKELVGLDKHIDDAIFQEKVKNKVNPIPKFCYYIFEYDRLVFGVFEIPVVKYDMPLSATVKLRSLEPGKFYLRRGSSNAEANGYECISIAKWLEGLPAMKSQESVFDKVTEIIGSLTKKGTLLSDCITTAWAFAKSYQLEELELFCSQELQGFKDNITQEDIHTKFSYRTNHILFTPAKIEISPYLSWDSYRLMKELRKMEDVYEHQMFFSYSIMYIEEIVNRLTQSNTILFTIETPASIFVENENSKDLLVTVYANKDTFDNLLRNIRQKLIDELLNISPGISSVSKFE